MYISLLISSFLGTGLVQALEINESQSSIWTEPVKCIPNDQGTTDYCVYTSSAFANGRGISFFTTPKIAEKVVTLPAFTKDGVHKGVNKFDDPPWEVKFMPGRGNGLFATRTLYRGDRILATTALGLFHTEALPADAKIDYLYLHTAFMQLPKESQDRFLKTMAASENGDPIMGRITTNAFAGELEGDSHFLFYPETALLNHDCRPNSMYYYDPKTLIHETTAARTIEIGEELTVPYTNILASREGRQFALKEYFGFTCTCALCSGTEAEVEASDIRLEKIVELQTLLSDYSPSSVATTAMAEELIMLYAEEGLHAAKASGHSFAAMAYNAVGDTQTARWHADFALDAGMVSSGSDTDAAQMEILIKNPMAHWSYGVRRKHDEL